MDGSSGCRTTISLIPHNRDVRAHFHGGARASRTTLTTPLLWARNDSLPALARFCST
jgi:hypothetical protein